eukprot:TRINITY_DN5634_c0_g1_i1.p1 TRINITY_DN5634_c0_g1~~TRINITY_DN5634_c0_g1_i1.p1  ORF type:complete len:449 (-),score=129.96 TRINITY_DN5634_c0_g1_i1:229-1575(-)
MSIKSIAFVLIVVLAALQLVCCEDLNVENFTGYTPIGKLWEVDDNLYVKVQRFGTKLFALNSSKSYIIDVCEDSVCVTFKEFISTELVYSMIVHYDESSEKDVLLVYTRQTNGLKKVYSIPIQTAALRRSLLVAGEAAEIVVPSDVTDEITSFVEPMYMFGRYGGILYFFVYEDGGKDFVAFTCESRPIDKLTKYDLRFKTSNIENDRQFFDDMSGTANLEDSHRFEITTQESISVANQQYRALGPAKSHALKDRDGVEIPVTANHWVDLENKRVWTYEEPTGTDGFVKRRLCKFDIFANGESPNVVCNDETKIVSSIEGILPADLKVTCALGPRVLACRIVEPSCTTTTCKTTGMKFFALKSTGLVELVGSGNNDPLNTAIYTKFNEDTIAKATINSAQFIDLNNQVLMKNIVYEDDTGYIWMDDSALTIFVSAAVMLAVSVIVLLF